MLGKPPEDGEELVVLEEARPHIVLDEHGDVGSTVDLARLLAEAEHPLERGELAIDGGVGGARRLSRRDVRGDAVGGDVERAAIADGAPQVRHGALHAVQRASSVGAVVIEEHLGQVLEGEALDVRPGNATATHLAEPTAEKVDRNAPVGGARGLAVDAAPERVLDPPDRTRRPTLQTRFVPVTHGQRPPFRCFARFGFVAKYRSKASSRSADSPRSCCGR